MKLVFIVAHKRNSKKLEESLVAQKHHFTKLETTGGFLQKKNITYLMGVEDKRVDDVLKIVKKTCKTHEEVVGQPVFTAGQPGDMLIPDGQTKIKVGGATIFVVKAEKFVKI